MNENQKFLHEEIVHNSTTPGNNRAILKQKYSKNLFAYFAAATANLIIFESGLALSWPSPVIPKLTGRVDPETNPLGRPITIPEQSWFAGLFCCGAIISPLAAGWLVNKIGRKKTLLLLALPFILAHLIAAFAKTVYLFYLSRFMCGISGGSAYTVVPMFLGEISDNHNRGRIGALLGVFNALGIIYSLAIGPYMSIRNFCLMCLLPMCIFIPVFVLFVPETPQFWASVDNRKKLKSSLLKLRNKEPSAVEEETIEMIKTVQERNQNRGTLMDLFQSKPLRKGLIIVLSLVIIQPLCGIGPVMSYMQTIFDSTGSKIPSEISSILVGIAQLIAASLTSTLVDKAGRRILLLFSSCGCFLSLTTLGVYFYLKNNEYQVDVIFWLPLLCFFVYIMSFCLGLGPLSWVILADLIPAHVRAPGATLASCLCFASSFLATFFFPIISSSLGMANSFWVFAMVCLMAVIFVYKMIPETKGKSSEEIQKMLEGYNKS